MNSEPEPRLTHVRAIQLLMAVQKGDEDLAQRLSLQELPRWKSPILGSIALEASIHHMPIRFKDFLLDIGADSRRERVLEAAVIKGRNSLLKRLLAFKIPLQTEPDMDYAHPALLLAIHERRVDMVKTLIGARVDLNLVAKAQPKNETALHTALRGYFVDNDFTIPSLLIKAGATLRYGNGDESALTYIIETRDDAILLVKLVVRAYSALGTTNYYSEEMHSSRFIRQCSTHGPSARWWSRCECL